MLWVHRRAIRSSIRVRACHVTTRWSSRQRVRVAGQRAEVLPENPTAACHSTCFEVPTFGYNQPIINQPINQSMSRVEVLRKLQKNQPLSDAIRLHNERFAGGSVAPPAPPLPSAPPLLLSLSELASLAAMVAENTSESKFHELLRSTVARAAEEPRRSCAAVRRVADSGGPTTGSGSPAGGCRRRRSHTERTNTASACRKKSST